MSTQKTDKVSLVGTAIIGAFLIIEVIVTGVLIAVVSVVAIPLIFLSDLIEKKVFRIKQVNLEDDPEWYRSGGRGSFF